eukprot:6140194-Amphidinium_carterae.1
MDGIKAVVKYVVTIGERASPVSELPIMPPSRVAKYSRILRRVPFSSRPGCLSAKRAILL